VLVARGETLIVPRGGTVLEGGDSVTAMTDKKDVSAFRELIEGPVVKSSNARIKLA
jgi:Trk K+ transport system NAD-binding subunit